jgi:hypothetical protein
MAQHRTTTTQVLPKMAVAVARAGRKPASADYREKRRQILTRDLWRCYKCGDNGKLVAWGVERCICRTCLDKDAPP